MKKNSKGNILITFIMITALTIMVFVFISLMIVRLKDSDIRSDEAKAFYIADAGIEKAVWYLLTPTASGGKGITWRTNGTSESYSGGTIYLYVKELVTGEVTIISTGDVSGTRKTIKQVMVAGGLPSAFSYGIYSYTPLLLENNTTVNGDVYVNGNVTLTGTSKVLSGEIYHPSGTSINGGAQSTYTDGGAGTNPPTNPTFDKSYYTALISTAASSGISDVYYNSAQTVNLNGATMYIKGGLSCNAAITFVGPGTIVTSGSMTFNQAITITNTVSFISSGSVSINGDFTANTGTVIYSDSGITINGSPRINVGTIISDADISVPSDMTFNGLLYATGTVRLQNNCKITGAVVSGAVTGNTDLVGNVVITYDATKFATTLPPGFASTTMSRKAGTWKGY
jgi:hypothetical protein